MKRAFSLILVSVMLLATVLMCKVDANAAEVEKKPFYFSNWGTVDQDEFPGIYSKPYLWAVRDGDEVTVSYGGKSTIEGVAQAMKEAMDEIPDGSGMRIMNVRALQVRFMNEQPEAKLFFDESSKKMAAWMDEFLAEYSRIGGKLDEIHSDFEYIYGYAQYLANAYSAGETEVYNDIINHPAYLTRLRPMLEERGFKFAAKPLDSMPEAVKKQFNELNNIKSGSGDDQSRKIWDVCVSNMHIQYLEEAFYEPAVKYYPDVLFDDWLTRDSYAWNKEVPESGQDMYIGGNTVASSTMTNYSYYNYAPFVQWVQQSESDTYYRKPVSHNDAIYEKNAFNMALWEINTTKNVTAIAVEQGKEIGFHFAYYDWALEHSANGPGGSSGTAYYTESFLHAGLADPVFGGYVIESEVGNAADYEYKIQVISEILTELNKVAGYADREPIVMPVNWNDSFVISGMYANGRNIWRITPDTSTGVSRKKFLVKEDENEVVFRIQGQTITFPKGNIIEDGDISAVGTCGYWVETPADVKPIVTNDADRYAEYPAYYEVFDNYETGATFDYKILKNSHTWTSWALDNATITIQEVSGKDKEMVIKGNAFLSNVKTPEYITAGDNYAKQQVWELAFKLDSLPTGDAEVKLLSATSGSGVNTDGGFRIFDGKLYYGKIGEYQAFENITLAANTEYKVKRVFDFRDSDNILCNYYIYDASGKLLDKAENVVIPSLTLPVQKIGISTENFASGVLHVDDYKLYATGVTTDLEIYNADTGMLVADATAAQSTNTAYRLSWMNASDATKIYNVVATYSDGTKQTLASIEMLPGSDAVNTGVVKLADGKSVTITLEETETQVPDAGDDTGDDGSGNGGLFGDSEDGDNTLLIVGMLTITVAIFCGCALALTLVITAKKKAAAPAADETPETEAEPPETDAE
ncbi:MAG: hypothetical protein IJA74_03345 [Oscillospiraceae bacterium]|nr:hypothetical protein [Oscillospiraceae bacterium]